MNSALPANVDELKASLQDPDWRIRNLYYVTDKDGREVLFQPWPEQEKLLRDLWYRNIILKARQRGFSTLIQLVMLDCCLFNQNTQAAVIAQDQDAATAIFRNKIRFAYDRLPEVVRRINPLEKDSASELILKNGSALKVATSVRSATLQWLHVSEFGKICARFPDKAREIVSGSLPAVDRSGIICIESTADGREGPYFEMCERAQAIAQTGRPLSKLDYKFHFAPWWDADEYEIDPGLIPVSPQDNAYFERIEPEIGQALSPAKRAWYVVQRDTTFSGDRETMFREYPSSPAEAFEQSTEGCYLADQLALARRQDRVGTVPYDPRIPVNTFWDLGLNDSMAIWLHQRVGLRDHWIGFIEGAGETYGYFVRQLQALGYVWGKHYLPHDGNQRAPGAEALKTPADMLEDLGLRDIEIVPRTADLIAAIQTMRDDFGTYWFDETACAEGLKHLAGYRKEWNDRLGVFTERPRKNGHQHAADALRQKAQGFMAPSMNRRSRHRNRSAMAV